MKTKLQRFKAWLLMLVVMVLCAGNAWGETVTVTKTVTQLKEANNWEASSGTTINTLATSFNLDDNITISTSGSANCGSIWGNTKGTTFDWRLYHAKNGDITIAASDNHELVSVNLTFTTGSNGVLLDGDNKISSNTAIFVSGQSKTFTVGNSDTKTNGQVKITQFSVTYKETGSDTPVTVAAPTFSLEAGTYYGTQSLELSTTVTNGTIYYTTDNTDPSESKTAVEYTSSFSISETTTIKAVVMDGDANFSDVVSKTYTIVPSIANTESTALTTSQAITLIENTSSAQLAAEKIYVKGTVSKVDKFDDTYKSITYWLDDDAFEIFSGKGINGADFTKIDDIAVGAEVVVCGNGKKFGSGTSTTYELDKNSELVSYTAPTAAKQNATITATGYKTSLVEGGTDSYTFTYNGDGTVKVESSSSSVATVSISNNTITITAVKAGTATIRIFAAESEKYTAAEKTYTLTVTEPAPAASLPFEFDGGKDDIANTTGMSQTGLSSDYSASPKLKFDSQGDNVVINYNEAAKNVTYTIKGNSMTGTYIFDVMESTDGQNYTTVHSHYSIGDATSYTDNLKADSRFVKFVYTTKKGGNVALGAIKITNELADPGLAFGSSIYSFFTTDSKKSVSATSSKGSTGAITYALTEGNTENFSINASTGAITCTTAGTYTVTATIAATDDYKSATATSMVKVIEHVTGNSIIVADTDNGSFAMTTTWNSKGYFENVEVYKVNDKYVVTTDISKILFKTNIEDGKTAIQSTLNNQYVQATAAKAVSYSEEEYKWTYQDNIITADNSSHGTLQYNVSDPRFTTYTSTTGKKAKISSNYAEGYQRDVNDGKFGTICLPYAVNASDYVGATFFSIKSMTADETGIILEEVENLEAGKPYIFEGNATNLVAAYSGEAATEAGSYHGLVGTFDGTTPDAGNYVIVSNEIRKCNESATVGKNRAYIVKSDIPTYSNSSSSAKMVVVGFAGTPTSIESVETTTDAAIYDLQGRRVVAPVRGQLYISNGQKFIQK